MTINFIHANKLNTIYFRQTAIDVKCLKLEIKIKEVVLKFWSRLRDKHTCTIIFLIKYCARAISLKICTHYTNYVLPCLQHMYPVEHCSWGGGRGREHGTIYKPLYIWYFKTQIIDQLSPLKKINLLRCL